jgi:hypothetical protein
MTWLYRIVSKRTIFGKKTLLQRGSLAADTYGKQRWWTDYEEEFTTRDGATRRVQQNPAFWGSPLPPGCRRRVF